MNILLTVEELAKYLKIKPDTIYKKVRKGELPAVKLGKLVRFPKEAIDHWVTEQANWTLKEMRAARQVVETRVGEAMHEVRKKAKAATRVINAEVPEVYEEVKRAPLAKKQETLRKGLKTLWKDLSNGVARQPATRTKTKAAKPAAKRAKKATGRSTRARPATRRAHGNGAHAASASP